MAGRKKPVETPSRATQTALTNYFSMSQPSANRTPGRTGDMERLDEPDSNGYMVKTEISSGSSSLSSAPDSPPRRSSRLRASATPAPAPLPKRQRVFVPLTPPRMPPGRIKGPSPLRNRDKRRRASPPCYWTASDYCDPSDTDEVPSSQKDDAEVTIDDDLETLESIPIFHMSSPSTSLSSVEPPTPAVSTPPHPLSPDSKTRHIIEEIRAKARAAVTRTSPTLKRPHSPLDDSDDDDSLPDGDFFFGNKDPPSKRRASSTPSPNNVRRSARKSKRPNPSPRVVARPRPQPALNPFAAVARERAARAKREESLPRAPDGSRQTIFDVANAALLRDPDDSLEDESGSQEANAALDQLAVAGFADEAERVRRAGSFTKVETEWQMFATQVPTDQMLPDFPHEVQAVLTTPFAKRVWGWIADKVQLQDHDSLAEILNTNLVEMAFSDPNERPALEKVIGWLVELVALAPTSSLISASAQHQALCLVGYLGGSDAHDRITLHIARCALRAGPPGEGVRLARSMLGELHTEPKYAVVTDAQRSSRVWLCASLLRTVASRAKNIFPAVVVLCLLGLDPSLEVGTRSEIAETVEQYWISKAETPESQLSLCSSLFSVFSGLPIRQKRDLVIKVVRGTRSIGVQLCMWLAIAFLDGKGLENVSPQTYTSRPPLDRIAAYANTIHTSPETNYADLLCTAQLLDIAMWDVGALVQAERSAGRAVKYQAGVPIDSIVAEVIAHLADVHGRILDARATDLEKTTTKAYLQTLQVRLGWDLMEAARSGQRKGMNIKEMWGKPRPRPA
ncbi:unnamed protein product [Rhizoctonia solani]|uniref:Uncharacterized protein n=3 Tax=Rhizoctonia solani TaxID=456999 RepID=A0A8H3C906_9AGAM|nr:hypothetical protein RSOL_509730 [Rhizoctonia solani AG-3 Rhs1AP]KEP53981.1 hypothetical protein V565_023600 [Rhizoctonia solani 123E]CAE6476577.1 unnamed protein product [Rhizoctonia solani]CAE6515673.1 unnamed protein product [Rhizoctonia solani]